MTSFIQENSFENIVWKNIGNFVSASMCYESKT